MKKGRFTHLPLLLMGIAVLLTASAPLMAQQVSSGGHMMFYPPVRVAAGPQNPSNPTGILPGQFKAAYGFNQIPNQGQGQTIAIVDAFDHPNIASDLAFYANYFHLTPCNFTKVKIGNPATDSGWGLEIALDVEQACALAPRANIILVEATTNNDTDLFNAVQVAYSAPYNSPVVSMSWGGGEDPSETTLDSYFCNAITGDGKPVTFFTSSGDGGHGAQYPAASPCVVAVGGTTLVIAQAAPLANPLQLNYGTENGWRSGGGGVSAYESQPSWQNPACATWSTTKRCIPDISSVAQNIPVYDSFGYSGWVNVAGTSISSPDWAAFATLANSVRANHGKGTFSQFASDLYQIYYSSNYAANFHDITTGNNGNCGSQCQTATGYDLVTGVGTFKANVLVNSLAADPN